MMFSQPILRRSAWLKHLGLINKSRFGTSRVTSNTKSALKENVKSTSAANLKEGQILHGFIVDQMAPIKEMHLTAIRLTHLKTGAQYLHLDRDDSNNVFSIMFRTTPMDSTGLPHILEHVALCGSEKYPYSDPFAKMKRHSLATFISAMTTPDYTYYPFSTQNLKDFRNLQSVYLDSVFKPLLRELDFFQEGWRLEHTDPDDKKSPIIFNGVVYNEMKGHFNSNQNIFGRELLSSLLPSHTYSVVAAGDPLEIPKLKYQDLINFHSTHYHPSNAKFYSYGNFPLEGHLKFINDEYLFLADKIDTTKTKVPSEKRWSAPKRKHILCRPDPLIADPNRQNAIAIASLCNDICNIQEGYNVYFLAQILLGGPNSAFYKSLVDTNIGTGFGPMSGYESDYKDNIFAVSLQGVQRQDFEKVEKIYDETVAKVIEDGFEKDHIETVLHHIELQVKHQTSNFGLNLLYNVLPLWNHDADVIDSLKIDKAIANFREAIERDPNYLKSLTEKYLLKNNHKLTMTMSPSQEFEKNLIEAENALLESKLKSLTPRQKDNIYEQGQDLLAHQEKKEVDVAVALSSLEVVYIKKDVDRYDLVDTRVSGIPVQLALQPTNGVCYYRGIISTRHLAADLKDALPIFNDVVTKMGTENYNYHDWERAALLKSGGLTFSSHVGENKDDGDEYEEGVLVGSCCLEHNAGDTWRLWEELFSRARLTDLRRFETLVRMAATSATNGIAEAGHRYAMGAAGGLVSPVDRYKEGLSGMEFVSRMRRIARAKDLSPLLERVRRIAEQVLRAPSLRSAVNATSRSRDEVLGGLGHFYGTLRDAKGQEGRLYSRAEPPPPTGATSRAVHHVLPYAVNYAAKAVSTVPYCHPDHAALRVLAKLLTAYYLSQEIQGKGGAYGAGARLSSSGTFYFYSECDPNSTRTLDLFDKAHDFLSETDVSRAMLVEAKLQVFQKIDAPVDPCDRGMSKFMHDLSYDDVQALRVRVMAVTREQLLDVADRYLSPGAKGVRVGRALIGPHNADLKARHSENWVVLAHEEQCQAQAI